MILIKMVDPRVMVLLDHQWALMMKSEGLVFVIIISAVDTGDYDTGVGGGCGLG